MNNKTRVDFWNGFFLLVTSSFMLLSSCLSDDVNLPDTPLSGTIDGIEWNYRSANGYRINPADFTYRVRFLSDEITASDPCTVPNPSIKHVSAVFRPSIQNFTFAPQVVSNNEVVVVFETSPSVDLRVNSGFMEVFAIENNVVFGYLQAVIDEENTVEGAFEIRLCN